MFREKSNPKLTPLANYETLRRKEYDALAFLLDTLTRVDGLPDEQMEQARDALFHADHPFLIVLVGAFNTGKSSIVNALIGQGVLDVGATPTTAKIAILRHGPSQQRLQAGEIETVFDPAPLLERLSLVDTPGLDSVFQEHDAVTRRFLHRADLVWLVMLATQAMSAASVAYIQSLRAYGKRVIVIVNQVDTLEAGEQETLKAFIAEQSQLHLGFVPPIWMVSARQAIQARQSDPHDEALWQSSGFAGIERYLADTLGDVTLMRQKLETPVQIARNVLVAASARVREQQNALGETRRAAQSVRAQIEGATREQQGTVAQTKEEISRAFAESIRRGREAIQHLFQFSHALPMAASGFWELLGLAGLFRRFGARTPTRAAFDAGQVAAPLDEVSAMVDRLAARLEGRDVRDVDELVAYAQSEITRLPEPLRGRVVGKPSAPATYNRTFLRDIRAQMASILDKARSLEFKRVDMAVRNWLLLMGAYEFLIIVAGVVAAITLTGAQGANWLILFVIILGLGLCGLALLPLRGSFMQTAYAQRMLGLEAKLEQLLDPAAQEQIAAGAQMRLEAVGPFIRLVESQIEQIDQLRHDLDAHEQRLVALEKEIT